MIDPKKESSEERAYAATGRRLDHTIRFVIKAAGGRLISLTLFSKGEETLLTLKADFNQRNFMLFVLGKTPSTCLKAAETKIRGGTAKWSRDRYDKRFDNDPD